MAMGIAVVGGECVYISGCGWEEGGLDYFPELYTSFESCEEGCLQEKDSQDFAGMDFGECIVGLGFANVSGSCVTVSRCSTDFNGIDYSYTFYDSFEECYESCFEIGEGCTYSVALNYNPNATIDDGSCLFPECISECTGDINGDECVTEDDILILLSSFGVICN